MKCLALVVICLFAGCKKDETASTATPGSADTETGARKRDGKIPLPPGVAKRNPHPDDDDDDGGEDNKNWDPAKREEMRQKFEEMRKEREKKLDLDNDGKISDDERAKARHERAVTMRTRLDKNGDGKVTAEEMTSSPRLSRRFPDVAQIDTDKNGDISADEIDTAMGSFTPGGVFDGGGRGRWRTGSGSGATTGSATQ